MSQASTTWIPIIPLPTSNPFPTNISPTYTVPGSPPTVVTVTRPNPLALDFTAEQIIDMAAVAALTPYLGSVVPAGSTTVDVPGVFMTSDNSVSILGGAKAAGLFFAPVVSSMANRTVGAIWANNAASANDLRYFPYYTHAFGHSPGANTTVGAVEHHATAYGKLP